MTHPDRSSFSSHDLDHNLLPKDSLEPAREPRHRHRWCSWVLLVLIIVFIGFSALLSRSTSSFFVGVKNGFLVRQITHLFGAGGNELRGEKDDRINFLLMGIGGPGHEGPYLTDTIILASLKPSTRQASMLSIPRDLIVQDTNGQYVKINSVYAYAQKQGIDAAFTKTKAVVGSTFDIPIDYMGVVDFDGFVKLVDTINGVDVDVERTFTDHQFPIDEAGRVTSVTFTAGRQHMNGLTSLRYARSRHGNNSEGSDFARSKRQQKIIMATKQRLASFNTLLNPWKLTSLYSIANEYTKTDLEPWELVKLVQLTKDLSLENIQTIVLDDTPGGYLTSGISSIDGAYILQPRDGNYEHLRSLVKNFFTETHVSKERPSILIANGTDIPNLAATIASSLKLLGIEPVGTVNADRKGLQSTQIYDYSKGAKRETRDLLTSFFGVQPIDTIPLELLPFTVAKKYEQYDDKGQLRNLDFLVIVGQDVQQAKRKEIIRTLTANEIATSSTTKLPIPGQNAP